MNVRYLGKQYATDIRPCFDERMLWFEDDVCVVATLRDDTEHVQQLIDRWVEREAKLYLTRRVRELSELTDWHVKRVSFRRQTTIWGSCSSDKNLSLNLQLIHLAPELIDYVLIHELAHTVEMNHSRAFWALVRGYCPEYPQYKRALVAAHKQLVMEQKAMC